MEQTAKPAAFPWRTQINWPVIGGVLGVKLAVLIWGAFSYVVFASRSIDGPRGLLQLWNRWDAPHYLDLAQYGYQNSGELRLFLVFYPLYPWLTRLFAAPFGDVLIGAFLVSTVASIVAALLLYELAKLDLPTAAASRAVWFLLIFPTGYFLHIGYTESLFIALMLGSFWAARTDRWWLAGVLGAFATLSRVNGLLLIPALLVEAAYQWWQTRRFNVRWLWIGVIAFGFGGYLLLNYTVSGDPFTFLTIQREHWYKSLTWPWIGVGHLIDSFRWREADEIRYIFGPELIFIVCIVALAVETSLTMRPSYSVWFVSNTLLFISTSFILSVPRYSLILFPIFLWLAKRGSSKIAFGLLSAVSIALMLWFIAVFVQGRGAY
jgi:4-amino-4-deoxy-L-arabinose transferase-like glycosyltransferase